MQKRGLRHTLLVLLLVTGVAAGFLTFDIVQRFASGLTRERDVAARLERLSAAAAAVGAAHGAYVAPGQPRAAWLARASSALQLLREEVTMLGPRARSPEAAQALALLNESIEAIGAADGAAREHLRTGEDLMASDLLFAEGREVFDALFAQIHELQAAEHDAAGDEREALARRAAIVLSAWAFIWTVGLLALARNPPPPDILPEAEPAPADAPATTPAASPQPVDLDEAAAICTALSRLATTAGLPDLLARAARMLDASGLIVWLGAGEELFAATSHGYDPRIVAGLGPIGRQAENATAAAWRTGATRVVLAGPDGNGALVTPLFGESGCIGVLAAELRSGREADGSTRAVTAIVAAQLAAIVAAWPAPSAVEGPVPNVVDGPVAGAVDGPAAQAATA